LRDLLDALVRELQAFGQAADTLVICDTRPLAERAFAVASGIGWVGKHTNVIAPGLGSYIFLGEIVTSLALPPDVPRKIHCGSCTRCVKACPTGALRGDYTMDAGKCISDLTQMRGSIPRALRPLMGTWIWGCDLCQAICPPTRIAGVTGHARFAPPPDAYPDLVSLLTLSKREFEVRYRASSMGWRGPTILRRNAAVALGNTLDRATVPALLAAFDCEGSDTVREHIAWALQRIGSPQARQGIASRLVGEKAAAVRQELQMMQAVATK
jgi:epoxyqueuosine reductase